MSEKRAHNFLTADVSNVRHSEACLQDTLSDKMALRAEVFIYIKNQTLEKYFKIISDLGLVFNFLI